MKKIANLFRMLKQQGVNRLHDCLHHVTRSVRLKKRKKEIKPWWRYDVREVIGALKQLRMGGSASDSIGRLADIQGWSVAFRLSALSFSGLLVMTVTALLFWPLKMSTYRALDNDRKLMEVRYVQQKQFVANVPRYEGQIEFMLKQFGGLLDTVPESLEPVHVLKMVNQAAKAAGVQIERFQPVVEEKETYYAVLPVEIRLRGDFHSLAKFMELVSRMHHLITVDVAVVPSETHDDQLVLASLLKAYRNQEIRTEARP